MLLGQYKRACTLINVFARLLEAVHHVLVCVDDIGCQSISLLNLGEGQLDELLAVEGESLIHGPIH